jgi:hypothetical protein
MTQNLRTIVITQFIDSIGKHTASRTNGTKENEQYPKIQLCIE